MKTMKNFAAQQLSKKAMNLINGGQGVMECMNKQYNFECTITDGSGNSRRLYGCANEANLALLNVRTEAAKLGGDIDLYACSRF